MRRRTRIVAGARAATCAELLAQALALHRGEFLADIAVTDSDVFDAWVVPQRAYFEQRILSALERLLTRAAWCGASSDARTYARHLLALDPWQEESLRTMLRLLAQNGEIAAALALYRQYVTALAQELNAEPDEVTTALYEQIRHGDLDGLAPPQPRLVAPLPPTPLVGRRTELHTVCANIRAGNERCHTLTGPGGIGKTRLAIEIAHTLRYDFEDGVYLVELAALTDANLVADAIARTLGVKERSQLPLRATVRESLRSKHLLLLLDNFEHVVAAAPLVAELLAACPGLHVLVTSRAPLQIRAEQQFPLEPLPESDAVQLFLQCAHAAGASLPVDAALDYAAICERLDRLPLAIEIIAVRAQTLTPRELLHQLAQPLDAVASGARDVSARHQSLRRAIQWSYDLLDAEEQRVFRALGVFAGGCTAEAVQAVVEASESQLPALEALHRASLLTRQVVAEGTRFGVLETIREFAREELVRHNEMTTARDHHARHYAAQATHTYTELLRAEAPRWRAWIAADRANLRDASAWALERQSYTTALTIATGIWRYHWMAGSLREGLEHLERALEFRAHVPLELQSNALRAAGTLAGGLNDYPRAGRWLDAAIAVGWQLNDPYILQMAVTNFGGVLLQQGELDDARIQLEVGLSLARRGRDPTTAKFALGLLASLHLRLDNYTEAYTLSAEGLQLNRARHDPEGTADALRTLGMTCLALGDLPRARQLGEEAYALHHTLDHQLGMGLDAVLLGNIAYASGDNAAALVQFRHCFQVWREREYILISATVLDCIARSLIHTHDCVRATTLTSAAASIRTRSHVRLTDREQANCDATTDACRAALDLAAFTAAWQVGEQLSLEDAVALALVGDGVG